MRECHTSKSLRYPLNCHMFILDSRGFLLRGWIFFIKDGWPSVSPLGHQLLGQVFRLDKAGWRRVLDNTTRSQDGRGAEVLISDKVDVSNRYWGKTRNRRRRWKGRRWRRACPGLSRARRRTRLWGGGGWWGSRKVTSCALAGMSRWGSRGRGRNDRRYR
jgi:hypothetical protein